MSAALCVTCSLKLCTCAFLADVGQVVVAGHVIPLAILVSDGHHTVLPACEEVIRLVLPPVLVHLQASEQQDSPFAFHLSVLTQPHTPVSFAEMNAAFLSVNGIFVCV